MCGNTLTKGIMPVALLVQLLIAMDMIYLAVNQLALLLTSKPLDKQSQLMNSPCGDPNKELNPRQAKGTELLNTVYYYDRKFEHE